MIVDVQGKESKIGQKVAFAGGMKGASVFHVGIIAKINNKTVTIDYEVPEKRWDFKSGSYIDLGTTRKESVNRNSGMFAILEGV